MNCVVADTASDDICGQNKQVQGFVPEHEKPFEQVWSVMNWLSVAEKVKCFGVTEIVLKS